MISSWCLECKHFINNTLSCKAFPLNIPEDIITGIKGHTKPYKGDNGIQFEPIKEENGKSKN